MKSSAILFFLSALCASAQPAPLTAKELAAHFSTLQQNGSSYLRARFIVKAPNDTTTLQVQIKQRRTQGSTDVIYQILWPKERKGESVFLSKSGNEAPTGKHFIPPDTQTSLSASDMKESLFGSDLAYADIIENFYAWGSQKIVGEEMIGHVNCQILESQPDDASIYTSVRSWVDPDRLVPLRVEKFMGSNRPVRIIETTRVSKEDDGHYIPANLTVRGPRPDSVTEIEGSRLNTNVEYEDKDFTPGALQ